MPSRSAEAKARRDQNRVHCFRCQRRGHLTVECPLSGSAPAPISSIPMPTVPNTVASVYTFHSSECSSSSTNFATGSGPSYTVTSSAFSGDCLIDEESHSFSERPPYCDRGDPDAGAELEPVTSEKTIEPIRPCTPPSASFCASTTSASRSIWYPIPSPLIPGRDVGNMSCKQINDIFYGEDKHMKCPCCNNEGNKFLV